nr:S8 family serine peptidase [Catenuloplanes japonicus]
MPPPWDPGPPRANPWPVVGAVFAGLWFVAVTVTAQWIGWFVEQLGLATTGDATPGVAAICGVVAAVLAAIPSLLLALLPKSVGVRAAGRAWLLGAGALGVFSLLRLVPTLEHEFYLLALAMVASLGALLLRLFGRTPHIGEISEESSSAIEVISDSRRPALLLALGAGLAILTPWLWAGALGGLAETVLAVAAAASIGWFAASVLDEPFWRAYGGRGGPRIVLVGGLVAGVALAGIAGGAGQAGTDLAMLMIPIAAFAAAALQPYARAGLPPARPGRRRVSGPVALIVTAAATGPLAFVDPEEITLLLSGRDVPYWTGVAALCMWLVALVAGLAYGLILAGGVRRARTPVAAGVAVLLLAAAGVVYAVPGTPGLFGDRLFVIMADQPDLSGVDTTRTGQTGRDARVTDVYRALVAHAEASQRDLRAALDRLRLDYTPYYLVNAVEVDAGTGVRAWLESRDDVAEVRPSPLLRPLPEPVETSTGADAAPSGPTWAIRAMKADLVWEQANVRGAGIVVGTSDSGVDGEHPALRSTFRGGDDSWYDPWNHTATPTDHGGHGTHTIGSAVGANGIGVAPEATWVGCVNLDRNLGSPTRYLDCLQFMLAPFPPGGDAFTDGRPPRAPHVLTNSWGCPDLEGCDLTTLQQATAAFTAAGIMFVAAAGNSGPSCDSIDDPPAPYADVLTVGAVNSGGDVSSFSSRGPAEGGAAKPEVMAPGEDVLSAMPGGTYGANSGTSMATPHVAGEVALLWSAQPALIGDLARTRALITGNTTPVPSTGDCGAASNEVGTGLVDAQAAVAEALGS